MQLITNCENLQAELQLVIDLFYKQDDVVKIVHNISFDKNEINYSDTML